MFDKNEYKTKPHKYRMCMDISNTSRIEITDYMHNFILFEVCLLLKVTISL